MFRSSIGSVSNSVQRSRIGVVAHNGSYTKSSHTGIDGRGHFAFVNLAYDIFTVGIEIPRAELPVSGKFNLAIDFASDFAVEYRSVVAYARSNYIGAHSVSKSLGLTFSKNDAGEFYLRPTPVTFGDFSSIIIEIAFPVGQRSWGGFLNISLSPILDSNVQPSQSLGNDFGDPGTEYNQRNQLVNSQNETNGLIRDMIAHISDQLAALWDQIYNYGFLPLFDKDNNAASRVISKLDESISNVTQNADKLVKESKRRGNFIVDGIKGLFLPSDDFFGNYFSRLSDWFSGRFGLLGYPIEVCITFFERIKGVSVNNTLYFPSIVVPLPDYGDAVILAEQDISLPEVCDLKCGDFSLLFYVRMALDIVMVSGVFVLLRNKMEEIER